MNSDSETTPFVPEFSARTTPLSTMATNTAAALAALAAEQAAIDHKREALLAAAAAQYAELGAILGANTTPTGTGSAPLAGRVTNTVWPSPRQLQVVPSGIAAAQTAAAAPTASAAPNPLHDELTELANAIADKLCRVEIVNGGKLRYLMNIVSINVGSTLKKLLELFKVNGFFEKDPQDPRVCYIPKSLVLKVLTAACRTGNAVPKDADLCKVAEVFFALATRWNPSRTSKTLEQFALPIDYATMMGAINLPKEISKLLVPTTADSIEAVLDQLHGVSLLDDYHPKTQVNRSTSGGGGGGGSAVPTKVNTRSIKAKGQGETGAEFVPTGLLAAKIKDCRPPIAGAPPKDPAGYKCLGEVLKENNIAYNKTTNSFSSSDTTVTEEMIEKILCTVFKLQTQAEIAEANREAAQRAFQAKQAAEHAAQNASIGGGGAFAVLADDVDAAAAVDAAAEDAAAVEEDNSQCSTVDNGVTVYGPRGDFNTIVTGMLAEAAETDVDQIEKILDTVSAEFGVYINVNGVYCIRSDDTNTVERTKKIAAAIMGAIANLSE